MSNETASTKKQKKMADKVDATSSHTEDVNLDAAETTEHSEDKTNQNKEVIIVLEDSIPNRNILKVILEKLGYAVLIGDSGLMGLTHVDRCIKENLNLVAFISDIMMPDMDGLAFLDAVKKNDKVKSIPFIFVTAAADKENVIEARKRGVTAYLLKPVSMDQIKTKLHELFPNKIFPSIRRAVIKTSA